MESKEEQFLDLIAENTQLKEEIKSVQEFNKLVSLLDQAYLIMCREQSLNEQVDLTKLDKLITSVTSGMRPVNSAESWKYKLKQEIYKKSNHQTKLTFDNLSDRKNKSQAKLDNIQKDIQVYQSKLSQTTKSLNSAQQMRDKLKSQLDELSKDVEKSKTNLNELKTQVEIEQASNIQIKRTMEQTEQKLVSFSESLGGAASSQVINTTIEKLKSSMKTSSIDI
ncbi:hypothetical protein TVAG_463360 [Trichomonas vaginalis G3]|uniref:Uncharacterized protein n=1 Tax=Trichomonas vaginalis (strain ATCC PRA-98 / G3) TaxID=412133 RepID=A2EH08_TRIV3|nr:tropomyosin family [Trichomonas vaginalis G3]EAY08056.1 hypothetical protein TVAG_463360 [Trichomonas vaginalis G3]KAI5543027.1 tropomyosin family [Trichomonas vaginalis G3]|eukprot:XP_001320279.1 hypothetical protein [Trichomonas vaginalis G3]